MLSNIEINSLDIISVSGGDVKHFLKSDDLSYKDLEKSIFLL